MTVDQTTQLIQLILNSVMMVTACIIVLGGLMIRYVTVKNRLQVTHKEYLELLTQVPHQQELLQTLKGRLRHLRHQHRMAHGSVLTIQYALLFFVISIFALTLRTILDFSWLIPIALIFFTLGILGVLISVTFTLNDFHVAGHSIWREIRAMMPTKQVSKLAKLKRIRKRSRSRRLVTSTTSSSAREKSIAS